MSPEKFRNLRISLNLTVNQVAKIMGVTPVTVRRWEMDPSKPTSRAPNQTACQVMLWMFGGFRPPEWPKG